MSPACNLIIRLFILALKYILCVCVCVCEYVCLWLSVCLCVCACVFVCLSGPTHSTMQSPGQTPLPPTSVSMPASGHGSAVGYSHPVASSQGVQVQSQGQNAGGYVSRGNMGMQTNQGERGRTHIVVATVRHQGTGLGTWHLPTSVSESENFICFWQHGTMCSWLLHLEQGSLVRDFNLKEDHLY